MIGNMLSIIVTSEEVCVQTNLNAKEKEGLLQKNNLDIKQSLNSKQIKINEKNNHSRTKAITLQIYKLFPGNKFAYS